MNKIVQPQWLEWAKELQFIAQGGLTYSKDVFDIERFERIREITAEMLSLQSEIPIEKVKNLFWRALRSGLCGDAELYG